MNRPLLWLLFALVAAIVMLAAAASGATETSIEPGMAASIVGLTALAALTGASVVGMFRGRLGDAVQAIAAWVGIFALLAVVYSFKDDMESVARRVALNVVPSMEQMSVTSAREVSIPRDPAGMYATRISINGGPATIMLIDTGASTLVLTDRDARSAGIDVARLQFVVPVQTANGQAMAAPATIERVAIGPIVVTNVRALVSRPQALTQSLVGHTVLDRLESYEVRGGRMVLRGRE